MLVPSIDTLMEKVNSKYTLVTLSAKRARILREKPELFRKHEGSKSVKFVGMALEEIATEELRIELKEDNETT